MIDWKKTIVLQLLHRSPSRGDSPLALERETRVGAVVVDATTREGQGLDDIDRAEIEVHKFRILMFR